MLDVAVIHLYEELCVGELVACWGRKQLATESENNDSSHDGPDGPLRHWRLAVGPWLDIAQAFHGVATLWVA